MQRHIKGRQHPPTKHAVRYDTRAYLDGQQTTRPGVSYFGAYSVESPQTTNETAIALTVLNDSVPITHGGAPVAYGSFEIAYACMPFDQFLTEDFHRQSSSMLRVAITLPTTTITTVPIHRHAQISPYMRTCKSPPSPFGKGGLCNQDCRLQAQVAYVRREAGPGTSPPAPRDRPHRCRRACSAARRGRPCPR